MENCSWKIGTSVTIARLRRRMRSHFPISEHHYLRFCAQKSMKVLMLSPMNRQQAPDILWKCISTMHLFLVPHVFCTMQAVIRAFNFIELCSKIRPKLCCIIFMTYEICHSVSSNSFFIWNTWSLTFPVQKRISFWFGNIFDWLAFYFGHWFGENSFLSNIATEISK